MSIWNNDIFQTLVFSAAVLVNVFFLLCVVISIYLLFAIGKIKKSVENLITVSTEAVDKVQEAAINASEASSGIFSFLSPFLFRKSSNKKGIWSIVSGFLRK
jgi:hypothetical protein